MSEISKNTVEVSGGITGRTNVKRCEWCKSHVFQALIFLLVFTSCQYSQKKPLTVTIKDYRVFYDGQDEGFNTISGSFVNDDDKLTGVLLAELMAI